MEKSGVVAADDDPEACDEAPGVVDESHRGSDAGSPSGGKMPAKSARVVPMKACALPATALEVPASDETIVVLAFVTRGRSHTS
jgi:hypothetical protein